MVKYLHDISKEKFDELYESKLMDDKDAITWLQKFIDEGDDRRFNFTLLNLGTVMKICAIELDFKSEEIENNLKLEKERTRDRKMNFILKELNKKINLRYEFDDDTEIVPSMYTYEGKGYIYVDKSTFIKLLYDIDIDIETLENV